MNGTHEGIRKLMKSFHLPKLTQEQKAKIREYHEYNGDKVVRIVGAIPMNGVLVRVKDSYGREYSVIDSIESDGSCSEYDSIEAAGNDEEVDLIKNWLCDDAPELLSDEVLDAIPEERFGETFDELMKISERTRKEGVLDVGHGGYSRIRFEDYYAGAE